MLGRSATAKIVTTNRAPTKHNDVMTLAEDIYNQSQLPPGHKRYQIQQDLEHKRGIRHPEHVSKIMESIVTDDKEQRHSDLAKLRKSPFTTSKKQQSFKTIGANSPKKDLSHPRHLKPIEK